MEEQKIELKMINMADIMASQVDWLWYPFIPMGSLLLFREIQEMEKYFDTKYCC